MRRSSNVLGIVMSCVLAVLFVFDVAISENETGEAPDLNLSPAEEQALKLQLDKDGVFERVYRNEPLSQNEKEAFAYLTRLVPVASEADPEDIDYELKVYFKESASTVEIADFLQENNCSVVRELLGSYLIRIPDRTRHEEMLKQLARGKIVASVGSNPFLVTSETAKIRKNVVYVVIKNSLSEKGLNEFQNENYLKATYRSGYLRHDKSTRYHFFVLSEEKVAAVVKRLSAKPVVAHCGPVGIDTPEETPPQRLPNDPDFGPQWNLHQNRKPTGLNSNGDDSRNFDIDGPEGWNISVGAGSPPVEIIAIIDGDGFLISHDDLDDRWWVNDDPAGDGDGNGLPGGNGDDDGDGAQNFNDLHVRNRDYNRNGTILAGADGICDAGPDGDYGFGPNGVDDDPPGPGGGDDTENPWNDNLKGPGTGTPFDDDMADVDLARSDDDENGYKDDLHGYDFVNNKGAIPVGRHGTMVAGHAGAESDNNSLVASVNWTSRLMALFYGDTIAYSIEAINYAKTNKANVINMSFGGSDNDDRRIALDSAQAAGIVLVASAGNRHDTLRHYPSDYPKVIEVAGTDDANRRYYRNVIWGSGFGRDAVGPDVCAPGEDLLCLDTAGTQATADGRNGTSFAAPQVAGLAALIIDKYNLAADPVKVRRILKAAVTDVEGRVVNPTIESSQPEQGPDDLGKGRINVFKALAPPRVVKVQLEQGGDTLFEDGDLNGDNELNCCDPDIDGDDFKNKRGTDIDQNDDGDSMLDADDTDDDGDGIVDADDDEARSYQKPDAGELKVKIQFNESMLMGGEGGVDPTVTLIKVDGTELTVEGEADTTDWSTWSTAQNNIGTSLENDTWTGKVNLTADDANKCACIRLKISGSQDIAGEAIDYDLDASGDQGYEYIIRSTTHPDYGDAPDPAYPTLEANDGARHDTMSFEWLGDEVCGENDANDPDDPRGIPNLVDEDEFDDGVTFYPPYRAGVPNQVTFKMNTCGMKDQRYGPDDKIYVNAWFDWNGDGDWDGPDEHVFTWEENPADWSGKSKEVTRPVTRPANPPEDEKKPIWVRFRLDYDQNVDTPTGEAAYGEVEDYLIPVFIRGDATADGSIDIFDALRIIYWLGGQADPPPCVNAADADDNEGIDIFDFLRIIYWLGGMAPQPPRPCCEIDDSCGIDPTPGYLGCKKYPPCDEFEGGSRSATAITSVGSSEESRLAAEEAVIVDGSIIVPVTLTNAEPVLGFNFAIEYDADLLTAKYVDNTGAVTEGFAVFAGGTDEPGLVKIAAVSDIEVEDGIEKLPAGEHQVARIVFELNEMAQSRNVTLKVANSVMAVGHDRALNHRTVDGIIKATSKPPTELRLNR